MQARFFRNADVICSFGTGFISGYLVGIYEISSSDPARVRAGHVQTQNAIGFAIAAIAMDNDNQQLTRRVASGYLGHFFGYAAGLISMIPEVLTASVNSSKPTP